MEWKRGEKKWVEATRQPRKQRGRLYRAPLHLRQKLVSAPLVSELREKFKARSLAVRKGDKVKVLVGKFRGVQGKVVRVDLRAGKVWVENAITRKMGGREEFFPLHPSTLLIMEAVERREEAAVKAAPTTSTVQKAVAPKPVVTAAPKAAAAATPKPAMAVSKQ